MLRVKLILIFSILPVLLQGQTVRLAGFKLEPFMMVDEVTGEATGVTIDYWKNYVAPEMGIDLEIIGIFPISRAVSMLESGEIDVVPQMTKIPAREELFLYPENELSSISSCLIVRKDYPLQEITGPEDMFGMTIAFLEETYLPPIMDHREIILDKTNSRDYREINTLKLISERVDGSLDINYLSVRYFLDRHEYLDQVRFIMLPSQPVFVYSIFHDSDRNRHLLEQFNEVNARGLSEGVFDRITREYILDE